ncbi:hypothetical protein ACFW9N_41790 [Streptomyces sp. NPDC059496]|uniref:hypothetical protein n=1 Tax=Streptomyces sp. NPDC059496 TaxID=3346851 RepID=UPI0036C7B2A1
MTVTTADAPSAALRAVGVLERIAARVGREAAGALCDSGVLTLLIALVEAVEAAAAWHRAQEYRAQAQAAAEAAVLLREAVGLAGIPPRPPGAKFRTARVTRTSGRGLPPDLPDIGVPPRPWPGQSPPDRPGPACPR